MRSKIIKATAFLLIFILLFSVVQAVLTPDFNDAMLQNVWYTLNGFENLEEDSIEVLWLGASHVFLGLSPMKMYEDTGICSYCLSTSGQPMGLSCEMLKMALKTQSPSVVILEPNGLFYASSASEHWRYVMDNLPLSADKISVAREYASLPGGDGFWSVMFPILKFHDRWEELGKSDFVRRHVDQYYSAGELIVNLVSPNDVSQEAMDSIAERMEERNEAEIQYYKNGETSTATEKTPLWEPKIADEYVDHLKKMQDLCDDAGAELLLVAFPSLSYPMLHTAAWTKEKSDMVRGLANELGVKFLDTVYDVDGIVDFTTDTYDGGKHLNLKGAEKVTAYLETYLAENYDLSANKNDTWDAMLEKYDTVRDMAYFQMETDFHAYLETLIEHKDDWTVLIAASNEYSSALTEGEFALFDQLGLQLIREGGFADSYLAVTRGGEREYEATSPRRITYNTTLGDGADVSMISSGWYNSAQASIKIDGTECACNGAGLNIVVWDNGTGLVLDSVSVNTRNEGSPVVHTGAYQHFEDYESVVCLDGVDAGI